MTFSHPDRIESPSRLILSDRLLTLAEDADRAGCAITAEHLLELAHSVFDDDFPTENASTHHGDFRGRPNSMGAPPAIFAHLPVPACGSALRAAR